MNITEELDRGNQLYQERKLTEARDCYQSIVNEDSTFGNAWHNLGMVHSELGDFLSAIECFNKGIELGIVESILCRGNVFRSLDQPRESLGDYARTFVVNPESASAYNNYGNVLREMGRPDLAIPFLQAAQVLNPNMITAYFNEAVAHLLKGDYEKGWEKYEYRWFYEGQAGLKPKLDKPEWDGSQSLKDQCILVYSEQGFGDTIQFCRYIGLLQSLGASVILVTRQQLVPLFEGTPGVVVKTDFENLPPYDYHCALLSLPKVFKTTIDTIPTQLSYIHASKSSTLDWQKQLGPKKKMRVGLTWTGDKSNWINRYKRIPLEKLLELVADEHQFFALTIDITDEERKLLEDKGVEILDNKINNFSDTAGLIANLDVVITVDTAVAHLAGALGISTWIMLPCYAVDWRWLLNRNSSPWYPSARLFRQTEMNNWQSVIDNLRTHLELNKI
jgi:tetratricopeptide (TPR) repeat protein